MKSFAVFATCELRVDQRMVLLEETYEVSLKSAVESQLNTA